MVVPAKTPNPKLNTDAIHKRFRTPARTPLLPSEAENARWRRLKSTEAASSFLSSSSTATSTSTTSSSSFSSAASASRRSASPVVERTVTPAKSTTTSVQNSARRTQSSERRRPGTPGGVTKEMSSAAKQLVSSSRSLSVSFQGRSFSMPMSSKPASSGGVSSSIVRKDTPERRKTTPARDQRENSNSKTSDQRLWPGRLKSGNMNSFTRSLDFGAAATFDKTRITGSASQVKVVQKANIIGYDKSSKDSNTNSIIRNFELENKIEFAPDANSAASIASESDCVFSGSNASSKECVSVRGGPRGIVVQSRYWQETNKFRRGVEPSSPALRENGSSIVGSSKFSDAKKFINESMMSSPRVVSARMGLSSPHYGSGRPASPSKFLTSVTSNSSRGMPSPITMKKVVSNNVGSTALISSFSADMRRGKMGENRVVDGHELRLLYNRHLQWRFVNARAAASLQVQTKKIEEKLFNGWVATMKLRNTVQSEKSKLQLRKQILRLSFLLKGQVPFLENWESIEKDHCSSLAGAIEALEASVVCMPVMGDAAADIQEVKNAVYSALNVMQKMGCSIRPLLTEVEQADKLLSELTRMTTNAKALLYECSNLLSQLTAMEVKDFSLRAHILQLCCLPPRMAIEEEN